MKIGLVYDLRDDYLAEGYKPEQVAEFDSEETIAALAGAIAGLGHLAVRIGNAKALARALVAGERWDLVFNIAEGLHGRSREAQVPALLELYGIGYTLSDPLVCAVTLDKAVAKRLVLSAGLRTPQFVVVRSEADIDKIKLDYPLFAKPLAEGTGKGIDGRSFIDAPAALRASSLYMLEHFAQPVLVEEYLSGREFTTAVLGNGERARALGSMEVEILGSAGPAIYSYESKEECERMVRYSPLREQPLKAQVEELALACYLALECRDAARVDIRLDSHGRPSFLEVNPLPGIHPTHSDLPMIATQEGMSYPELVGGIIAAACERLGKNHD
jgi:D-alanine-D-alanine ligase